jgi:hypothetical protein
LLDECWDRVHEECPLGGGRGVDEVSAKNGNRMP